MPRLWVPDGIEAEVVVFDGVAIGAVADDHAADQVARDQVPRGGRRAADQVARGAGGDQDAALDVGHGLGPRRRCRSVFPATMLPVAAAFSISTPTSPLSEIRLPAPGAVPPMVFDAELTITTPLLKLPSR